MPGAAADDDEGGGGEPAGDHDDPRRVLQELRRLRVRRRLGELDVFEAFYITYLTAILVGLGASLLAGIVGDAHVSATTLADVRGSGPAVVEVGVAIAVALGCRSGALGGPVTVESAEVHYVLLAPVPRSTALRSPVVRSLRFAAFAGAVAGALAGLVALGRLPGGAPSWVASGVALGIAVGLMVTGVALVTSALRVGRLAATLAGAAVVGATSALVAIGRATPFRPFSALALAPLDTDPIAWLVPAIVVALVAVGSWLAPRASLEPAHRRSTLVGELRFAVTMQDLRTAIVLRRQLAQEQHRTRPWVRRLWWAPPRFAVWRRGWCGLARWPLVRPVRMVLLGLASGVLATGFWRGTDELLVGAGGLLWLAALDATESLSQEVDHPDRGGMAPVSALGLQLRHLPVGVVAMLAPTVAAAAAARLLLGPQLDAPTLVALVPVAAVSAALGAAVSIVQGPPPAYDPRSMAMPPETLGMQKVAYHVTPVVVATAGLLPLVAARLRHDGTDVVIGTSALVVTVLLVAAYTVWALWQVPRTARRLERA